MKHSPLSPPPVRLLFGALLAVALAGVYLRAMPFLPAGGPEFAFARHAHSHLAFLGWVYGAFFLALVRYFVGADAMGSPRYRRLFRWGLCTAAAMFVAFLAQGYGVFSIVLLSLHTVLAGVFFCRFVRDASLRGVSGRFALTAIGAFLLSALGPFVIPVVQRLAPGEPAWTRMAVHFYLHFHYEGWFVFGLLAIFYRMLEQSGVAFSRRIARMQWALSAVGLVPGYFLAAPLALLPAGWLPVVAGVPWVGMALFAGQFFRLRKAVSAGDSPAGRYLLYLAVGCIFLKYTLALLAVSPPLAVWIERSNHFLALGYLHLLFLGGVTPLLFWISMRAGWLPGTGVWVKWGLVPYTAGFVISEAYLFGLGLGGPTDYSREVLLTSAVLQAAGVGLIAGSVLRNKKRETQRQATSG